MPTFASRVRSLGPTTTDGPVKRTGFSSLFSGIERAVYVVGGKDAGGTSTHAIWRWRADDSTWSIVAPNASLVPTKQVLGVAYDQPHGRLFVLDVDDISLSKVNAAPLAFDGVFKEIGRRFHGRGGSIRVARLYRYDLGTETATLLAAWPYLGHNDRVMIAAMDDGSLALVTAGKNDFTAWRLDVSGKRARFSGLLNGRGVVLGEPAMGEQNLILPVVYRDKLNYVPLAPEAFRGNGRCDDL